MPPGNENCRNSRRQSLDVLGDVRVVLAVRAFEIGVGDQGRAAVPGPGDVDHVEIELADDAVQVRVDEVEARASCPSGRASAA